VKKKKRRGEGGKRYELVGSCLETQGSIKNNLPSRRGLDYRKGTLFERKKTKKRPCSWSHETTTTIGKAYIFLETNGCHENESPGGFAWKTLKLG